ncbi:VOC family protein [Streptomyces sp. F63]|uniref:VOC family protein n=1 Tax=Streptomyces sp. F63 TaxID=2824887 RepID=UPI001B35F73F|nr:VOC family protein [Streptomyces sp. F63]MBQ0987878.1 VOC family protein [Streptomyces sp. F63]
MSATTPVVQGAPCWVSLITSDLRLSLDFYHALLGWEFRPAFHRKEYVVAYKDGEPVAGIGALARSMGFPVAWSPYFAVGSADKAADRIRERGATVAVGPISFGPGRVAWAADPMGAPFGIWEGYTEPEWPVRRGPGFPSWIELRTRDVFAATIFYSQVLGWDTEPPERCDVRYADEQVLVRIEGRTVGGLRGGALESAPDPRIRPRWHVYFCVGDVPAAAEHAAALGGEVVAPPEQSQHGWEATLRDSQGGLFTVTSEDH